MDVRRRELVVRHLHWVAVLLRRLLSLLLPKHFLVRRLLLDAGGQASGFEVVWFVPVSVSLDGQVHLRRHLRGHLPPLRFHSVPHARELQVGHVRKGRVLLVLARVAPHVLRLRVLGVVLPVYQSHGVFLAVTGGKANVVAANPGDRVLRVVGGLRQELALLGRSGVRAGALH